MAAPNLRDPATVIGRTEGYAVTTTLATALSNAAASGKVFRVNAVYCANVSTASNEAVTLVRRRGGVDRHLAREIIVPVNATQVLVAREAYLYLEEGDALLARASSGSSLELLIGFEEIG